MTRGVDISEWNGAVDFPALKKAGIGFVLIRTGYGKDVPGQQDSRFEENIRGAEAAGLPWGVYHYSYARDSAGGRQEAAHVLRLLAGRSPAYGVWLDMEDSSTLGGDLAGAADGFCAAIEKEGLYVGVYANLSWWESYLTSPIFAKYDRWVAQWGTGRCQYAGAFGIWQYTDKLVIGNKDFDGNYAYKDYPALTTKKEEQPVTYEEWKAYQQRYEKEQAAKAAGKWAQPAIQYVQENGIMVGDTQGEFHPQSPVTRQELARVILALAGKT